MISNATNIVRTEYYEPVLLWERAVSTYAGETLTFSGNYIGYIVEFKRYRTGSDNYVTLYLPLQDATRYISACVQTSASAAAQPCRGIKVTSNSIVFGHGYLFDDGDWDVDDNNMIPTKIWGIIG